ncbi:indole-diterpene biosynthesis protein-like protein PaxU [Lentithecium fluviatile CBS 122367]|uniref:Indole-diterpene biosynthesis protein-like protein PaxU n=1 Tax=Lentithecium fluviatile CBS 122367 TaxID=1168545 RepID=A0A6G1IJ22_9PLEO|nr:indole-diterpene biosynthesis protein-like protein PaxU [Lentithecium fluviatile CBS 122367]
MATPISPAVVAKPLIEFQEIGHNTFLYTPPTYTSQEPLILLFAWNAAAAKHIAKYTVAYQKLFPTARILLIRSYTADIFRTEPAYRRLSAPAVGVVKEHTNTGGEVLVHSFSNGGGNQLNEFAKAWVRQEGSVLPMRAQVMDSSPGKGGWLRTHAAIMESLPRTWFWRLSGTVLVHLVLLSTFLVHKLTWKENPIVVMGRQMNDSTIFDVRTPRVYCYSRADVMVKDDEVEEHADHAEARGWAVKKVCFEKSPHAGHIREDERKYWDAVLEAWETGPRNC